MRKELIILLVLFSVFLAIGCAETKKPNETTNPAKEATPVTMGNKTGMMNNKTGMMENRTGMMENRTGMMSNATGMMENRTGMMGNRNI